jgi:hypothetical protein
MQSNKGTSGSPVSRFTRLPVRRSGFSFSSRSLCFCGEFFLMNFESWIQNSFWLKEWRTLVEIFRTKEWTVPDIGLLKFPEKGSGFYNPYRQAS